MFEILMRVFALINRMEPVVVALEQGTAELLPNMPGPTKIFKHAYEELSKAKRERVDLDNWYRIERHAVALDALWGRFIDASMLSQRRVRQAKDTQRMPKPEPRLMKWEARLSCF